MKGFKQVFKKGNKIYLKEVGKESFESFEYNHWYYVDDQTGNPEIQFKNFENTPVKRIDEVTRDSANMYKMQNYGVYENDLSPEVKFLLNRYEKEDKLEVSVSDFNICYIDIEVAGVDDFPEPEKADYPINLITTIDNKGNKNTFATEQYTGTSNLLGKYFYFAEEQDMLEAFLNFFYKEKFDIITGWNIERFDIPYIVNRTNKFSKISSLKSKLSPINYIRAGKVKNRFNEDEFDQIYRLYGITTLDYMDLYRNFTFDTKESYSLQFISDFELGEGKLELDGQINTIYKTNWNLFVEYNIQDVELVVKLEQKLKFISLAVTLAHNSLIPIDAVTSSISVVEGYILKYLHKNNMVMPDRKEKTEDWWREGKYFIKELPSGEIEYQNIKEGVSHKNGFAPFYVKGGYVFAKPALHSKVISFDITSSYPHQIMQYNISPETKVILPDEKMLPHLIESEINQVYYDKRKKGILPIVVKMIFNERVHFKNLKKQAEKDGDTALADYYDQEQHIRKIIINSFYGVLINKYFHLYDVDNARAITRGGRITVKYLAEKTNIYILNHFHQVGHKIFPNFTPDKNGKPQKINKDIVALIDTDSNYYCLDEIQEKYGAGLSDLEFFEKMDNFLQDFVKKILQIKADLKGMEQVINFNRESYINDMFILAKKKYLLRVIKKDDKFYGDNFKTLITGLELKKSDTPNFSKTYIMDLINNIFTYKSKEKNLTLIKELRKLYETVPIDDIARKSSINKYTKYAKDIEHYLENHLYFDKGTTMTAKASMSYNYFVKKHNLPLMPIGNGSKIKYMSLMKNQHNFETIAWIGNYPSEFEKHFKPNYDEQFEKTFLGIITRFWIVLGWTTAKAGINLRESKLNSFFKK